MLLSASRLRQSCGSPAIGGRGFEARSHKSRSRRSKPHLHLPWRAIRQEPNRWRKTLESDIPLDTQMQSLWLPAIQAQLALDKKNPAAALTALQAASSIELGQHRFRHQYFLPLSNLRSRRSVSRRRPRDRCRRRVSEDSRSQRHRLELLDRSVSASGRGACKRSAGENLAGRGCRRRPHSSTRRLQRFPRPLERRRPRHPHPERSQGGVREAAVSARNLS